MTDDEKFNLVFRGELVPGADLTQVKQNLSRLFKMDLARIDVLFSGKDVVLKRDLDLDTAGKYRVAIKKAGARVDTVKSSKPKHAAEAKAPEANASPSSQAQASSPVGQGQIAGLSLVPSGGDLLAPDEKPRAAPVSVDTTRLSLRPVGRGLLDDDEREQVVPLPIDLQGIELAPAGTEVLKPEERSAPVAVDVDLSGLSVAPPGERLESPKAAPPPAPDVSRLKLEDVDR